MQAGCKSATFASRFGSVPADPTSASGPSGGTDPTRIERAVTWLSMACAVHCLLVPVGAALLPLLGASSAGAGMLGRATDPVLNLLVLGGGAASTVLGFRRHRDVRLSLAMGACIVLYLTGHMLEALWYGRALSVFSGLGLSLTSFASARRGHVHSPETCTH